MRAIVTAVVAAIEGCAAAVAGVALIALPALLLWVVTFEIVAEPSTVASAVAGAWLLAHLVPMQFALSQETMLGMGLGQDPLTFTLSIAPLTITLVTVAFAVRAGRRLSRRGLSGAAGIAGGTAGFAAVTFGVATVAGDYSAWPVPATVAVPALVYFVSAVAAYVIAAAVTHEHWWSRCVRGMQRALEYLGVHGSVAAFPARAATVARLVAASIASVIAVSAVALAVAFAAGFADVIAIAQALQLDVIGSLLLFLAQLALLPIGIIWSLAWLSGAGFDAGGAFSPFHDTAGSIPSLPMLGALPDGWGSFGALAPVLLVLANVVVGVLFARGSELRRGSWVTALTLPVIAAACAGFAAAGLAALGSGSLGPGRLAAAGPDAWVTGGLVAAWAAAGLLLGIVAARLDYSRVREVLPEPVARLRSRSTAKAPGANGTGFADAETVDLSGVRDEHEAQPNTAPVVDLFAQVLHEPVQANGGFTDEVITDEFDTDVLEDGELAAEPLDAGDEGQAVGDPEQDLAEDRAEATAFDIETMKDTGEVPAPEAASDGEPAPEGAGKSARSTLEDAEAIERAFAWDAGDPGGLDAAGGSEAEGAGSSDGKRGRMRWPNWRGSNK